MEEYNKQLRPYLGDHGILCLTSDPVNIPMWGYYAENHTGYCVVFEINWNYVAKGMITTNPSVFIDYKEKVLNGDEIISFNVPSKKFGDSPLKLSFTKVNYSGYAPTVDQLRWNSIQNGYERNEYVVENSIGVKYKDWVHEKEYRIIAPFNNQRKSKKSQLKLTDLNSYVPFLRVKGIIIGAKMPEKNKKKVRDLCERYGVDCKQAAISSNEYKVII